jgi:6-phosphofructokinase
VALKRSPALAVVLGHLQRNDSPNAFDKVLANQYGVKKMEMAVNE